MKKAFMFLLIVLAVSAAVFAGGANETATEKTVVEKTVVEKKAKGPLVWVWYPNESVPELATMRSEIIRIASEAIGREIKDQTTTDYAIAIEALVNDNAAFSWFGGEGYVQAHARNAAVLPLATNSPSETLDKAKYYSMLGTLSANTNQYKIDGKFDLNTIKQKKFSFVSNSSTSGFRVPASAIAKQFGVDSQELLEGGKDMVFSEVMFGGSHQGSLFNVLTKKADIGAFCNECIANYVSWDRANYSDPKPGDVLKVLPNADAPFDQVPGIEVTLVATFPVLNAPFVVNTNLLSQEEVAAVLAAFTSEETRNNKIIFAPKGAATKSGFREGDRFLPVEDKWYDPIRKLSGLL